MTYFKFWAGAVFEDSSIIFIDIYKLLCLVPEHLTLHICIYSIIGIQEHPLQSRVQILARHTCGGLFAELLR